MSALRLTGTALAAALARASRSVIAAAVAAGAERARQRLAASGEAEASLDGAGDAVSVRLAAPRLFAREFGALGAGADPVIAPAIEEMRGGGS